MNISEIKPGDMLELNQECRTQNRAIHTPTGLMRGDGKQPVRGVVVQVTERLVIMNMMNSTGKIVYKSCFLPQDLSLVKDDENEKS